MPVCPKCGKYHKKSHHRKHVRTCVGWNNPALEHIRVSKGVGSKDYSGLQEQLKRARLLEIEKEITGE